MENLQLPSDPEQRTQVQIMCADIVGKSLRYSSKGSQKALEASDQGMFLTLSPIKPSIDTYNAMYNLYFKPDPTVTTSTPIGVIGIMDNHTIHLDDSLNVRGITYTRDDETITFHMVNLGIVEAFTIGSLSKIIRILNQNNLWPQKPTK